jgi:hypothetical protein
MRKHSKVETTRQYRTAGKPGERGSGFGSALTWEIAGVMFAWSTIAARLQIERVYERPQKRCGFQEPPNWFRRQKPIGTRYGC